MWKRILFLCLAVSVGITVAHNVNEYSYALRGSDVMAMSECMPDEDMGVPQPELYCTYCSDYHACLGYYERPFMQRGPIRRFIHRVRPVRRVIGFIGRLLFGRRC